MGNQSIPSPGKAASQSMASLVKFLPQMLGITNANILPEEMAKLTAAQATAPQAGQLSDQIAEASKLSSSRGDVATMAGPGRELLSETDAASRKLNPELYANRAAAGNKLTQLLDSYNLGGLSEGEAAAAERGINQGNVATGNSGVGSQLTTVGNAMNFGEAYNRKRSALSDAIRTASSATPLLNSGIDPVQTVLGRSSTSAGPTAFANVGANANTAANNMLGANTALATNYTATKGAMPTGAERILGALPDY